MGPLGIVVLWGGYLFGIWGFSKVKTAYGGIQLSLSDLALPSHRTTYLASTAAWTQNGLYLGPAVVNPATGINQYGGTSSASNPEGPAVPTLPGINSLGGTTGEPGSSATEGPAVPSPTPTPSGLAGTG